jgi:hypothetical protein
MVIATKTVTTVAAFLQPIMFGHLNSRVATLVGLHSELLFGMARDANRRILLHDLNPTPRLGLFKRLLATLGVNLPCCQQARSTSSWIAQYRRCLYQRPVSRYPPENAQRETQASPGGWQEENFYAGLRKMTRTGRFHVVDEDRVFPTSRITSSIVAGYPFTTSYEIAAPA